MTAAPDRDRGPLGTAAAMRRPGPWRGRVSPSGDRSSEPVAFAGPSLPVRAATGRIGGSGGEGLGTVGGGGEALARLPVRGGGSAKLLADEKFEIMPLLKKRGFRRNSIPQPSDDSSAFLFLKGAASSVQREGTGKLGWCPDRLWTLGGFGHRGERVRKARSL